MKLQDQSPSSFAELFRQATAPTRDELNKFIEQTQSNIQTFEAKYGFSSHELKEQFRRGVLSDNQGMELHTWLMELNTLEQSVRYRERFLFYKAAAYLKSNGFVDCDFSNYYPDSEGFEKCGCIGLSFHPDTLYIGVRDSECANTSPRIALTAEQEHLLEPILDVLMFAIRGKSSDDVWDAQIKTDFLSGKFDQLIKEAREEFNQGKAVELGNHASQCFKRGWDDVVKGRSHHISELWDDIQENTTFP